MDTAPSSFAAGHRLRPSSATWRRLAIVGLVVGVAVGAFGLRQMFDRAIDIPGEMPTNPAIESRLGVRVTHIGVGADGGLVDFRYIVLDADKAVGLLADLANVPVLRTEPGGQLVNSAAVMAGKHDVQAGRTYFLLYRNTGGAIKPGSRVTVAFGDLRLEHVPVE